MNSKNKFILFIGILFLNMGLANANPMFGKKQLINDEWYFIKNNSTTIPENSNEWQLVQLPFDWSIKGQLSPTLSSCTGFLPGGVGWFKKEFIVADTLKSKRMYIYFEGVYNRSEVFLNGHSLGIRPNGYISFMYDLTPYLRYGEKNSLTVRVDHSRSSDSRWYTGSGIYRDVYLVESNPIHFAQWGIHAYSSNVTNKSGVMEVTASVCNDEIEDASLEVINELFSPAGKIVARSTKKLKVGKSSENTIKSSLKVANPELWSLEVPSLYTLKTKVISKGEVLDENIIRTGFRTFTFDANKGFALNGKWMKMKGVCLHHDAGVLGSAVPREVWKRRLLALKEIGCNAVRTSHNPQAPDLYELCDELGILVLNEAFDEWEFPKRKWLQGWNVGEPGFEGNYDYFEEWGETDLADFVRRDRNHISIFAWSIGNEVDYPNDPYSHPVLDKGEDEGFTQAIFGGYRKSAPDAMRLGDIAKKLANVVKKYDLSRPITAGLAGVAMSNATEYPNVIDIAGYNYTESRYDSDHEKYPNRVIYGSENRHDMAAWKATRDREHIFGQFLWTGIDYLGESGSWPSRGFYSGLLDFGGNIKPRGYFRQSLWSEKPMAYLGSYPVRNNGESSKTGQDVWMEQEANSAGSSEEKNPSMDAWNIWNYKEGEMVRVVCYTNGAKAYLELNGREVGEMKCYDDTNGIIYWDIPFAKGNIEVVVFDENNNEIARDAIQSSKQPYAITVVKSEKSIDKDRGLAQIMLQIVDEDGVPVKISDNEITCSIIGSGTLLGLEASNNSDVSDYTDRSHRVFNGQLLAYVQAVGAGEIHLKFTSPWLKDAYVKIIAE